MLIWSDPFALYFAQSANFGTAKGKVKLGASQAKVSQWTDASISFIVPTTMSYGLFPITVTNSLGQSILEGAFTVVR